MTRQQLLKSLRSKINYYGRQGYVFTDLKPQELSTQKLVALQKLTSKKFLEETKPAKIQAGQAADKITYEAVKTERLKVLERERLQRSLNKKVSTLQKAGFGTQDLGRFDIGTMSAKELKRIMKLSREGLLSEFGTTYTFKGGQPGAERDVTITAAQQLEIEKALKDAKKVAKKHKAKLPGKQTFTTEEGRKKYLEYLVNMSTPGYFDEKEKRWAENYINTVRQWKGIDPELDYIASEIEKLPRKVILEKLRIMSTEGFGEFTPINYFDSNDNVYSARKGSLYALFGIKPFYSDAEDGESE